MYTHTPGPASTRSPARVSSNLPEMIWTVAGREAVCSLSSSPAANAKWTTFASALEWNMREWIPLSGGEGVDPLTIRHLPPGGRPSGTGRAGGL